MSLAWIAILSGLFLIVLVLVVYLMPTDQIFKRKKKEPPQVIKNWEEIALRWERQNEERLKQIEEAKKVEKGLLTKIDEQAKEYQALLDNLAQEKNWREKEHDTALKVKEKDLELKDHLLEAEENLEKEHTQRLRRDRELQELQIQYSKASDERRQLTTKVIGLEVLLEKTNKELRDLKRDMTELTKQKQDVQWVAKSDYDGVKKILAQKEKELERFQDIINNLTGQLEKPTQEPAQNLSDDISKNNPLPLSEGEKPVLPPEGEENLNNNPGHL